MTLECPMHYGDAYPNASIIRDLECRCYLDSPLVELLVRRLVDADDMVSHLESEIEEENDMLRKEIGELEEDVREKDKRIAELEKQLDALQSENDGLEGANAALGAEVAQLEAEIARRNVADGCF